MRRFILKYLLKDKDFILAEEMRRTANKHNIVTNEDLKQEREIILEKIKDAAQKGMYSATFDDELYSENRIKLITAGYDVTPMIFGTLVEW